MTADNIVEAVLADVANEDSHELHVGLDMLSTQVSRGTIVDKNARAQPTPRVGPWAIRSRHIKPLTLSASPTTMGGIAPGAITSHPPYCEV